MKRLGELACLLNATVIGDPDTVIEDAKTTARAGFSDITLVCSNRHLEQFLASDSPAAVVSQHVAIGNVSSEKSYIQIDDALAGFEVIVRQFRPAKRSSTETISPQAVVSESATVGDRVTIHPRATIADDVTIGDRCVIYPGVTILEGATIGNDTVLYPNVVLYENTIIGDRCIIHGGAVIGAYGFGYKSSSTHQLSAQLGNVILGDDVEIGANTTIDRGTFDSTTIGDGTKIDNLVMIGHNCQIGKHNLLCSQVGIAGSTETGDYVVMAGQVGIGDHLHIGEKVTIAAQSGVMHDLADDKTYLGSPAIPAREQMQLHAAVAKLPDLRKQIRKLQKQVDQMGDIGNNVTNEAA